MRVGDRRSALVEGTVGLTGATSVWNGATSIAFHLTNCNGICLRRQLLCLLAGICEHFRRVIAPLCRGDSVGYAISTFAETEEVRN